MKRAESIVTSEHPEPLVRRRSLVQWGASFAGAVSALALTALGMALWWAIGYGSGVKFIVHNMSWFFLGTTLASLLIGGAITGRVAEYRTSAVAAFDGMAVWALALLGALIPLSLRGLQLANSGVPNPARVAAFQVSSGDSWALFSAVAGGLLCAVVGSFVGANPRAVTTTTIYEHREEEAEEPVLRSHRAG
jgi:hypothetical protein